MYDLDKNLSNLNNEEMHDVIMMTPAASSNKRIIIYFLSYYS